MITQAVHTVTRQCSARESVFTSILCTEITRLRERVCGVVSPAEGRRSISKERGKKRIKKREKKCRKRYERKNKKRSGILGTYFLAVANNCDLRIDTTASRFFLGVIGFNFFFLSLRHLASLRGEKQGWPLSRPTTSAWFCSNYEVR